MRLEPPTRGVAGTSVRALRPSPFARLARTHALAMAGDALVTMALAGSLFFSISPNAARGRVALSLVLTMAPFAVIAPFLGPLVDRAGRGRRATVAAAGAGRAVLCLVMARVLDGLLLFPVAFGILVLSKAYSVAKSSLVPSAVGADDELVQANAKLAIVGVLAGLTAAAPGVLVLRVFGAPWVLRLAAVAFVVSAASAVRLVERRTGPRTGEIPGARSGAAVRGVVVAGVGMAVLRAAVGFLTFLVAFEFRRPPTAPAWWFGVVLAASMVASLLGAVVAPRLRSLLREERLLAGCLSLVAVAGLLLARDPRAGAGALVAAASMAAVVGIAAGAGKLAFDAIVQRDAPDAARGTAFARFEASFQLVWVVGALVPVVVTVPQRLGFAVLGVAAATACVASVAARRRLANGDRVVPA